MVIYLIKTFAFTSKNIKILELCVVTVALLLSLSKNVLCLSGGKKTKGSKSALCRNLVNINI